MKMLKIAVAAILPMMLMGEVFGTEAQLPLKYQKWAEKKTQFAAMNKNIDTIIRQFGIEGFIEKGTNKREKGGESNGEYAASTEEKENMQKNLDLYSENLKKKLQRPNQDNSCQKLYDKIMDWKIKDKEKDNPPSYLKAVFLKKYLLYKTAALITDNTSDTECSEFTKDADADKTMGKQLFIVSQAFVEEDAALNKNSSSSQSSSPPSSSSSSGTDRERRASFETFLSVNESLFDALEKEEKDFEWNEETIKNIHRAFEGVISQLEGDMKKSTKNCQSLVGDLIEKSKKYSQEIKESELKPKNYGNYQQGLAALEIANHMIEQNNDQICETFHKEMNDQKESKQIVSFLFTKAAEIKGPVQSQRNSSESRPTISWFKAHGSSYTDSLSRTSVASSTSVDDAETFLEKAKQACKEAIDAKVGGKWNAVNYFAGSNQCKRRAKEAEQQAQKAQERAMNLSDSKDKEEALKQHEKALGLYESCFVKAYSSNGDTPSIREMRIKGKCDNALTKNRIAKVEGKAHIYKVVANRQDSNNEEISFDPRGLGELSSSGQIGTTPEQFRAAEELGTAKERLERFN